MIGTASFSQIIFQVQNPTPLATIYPMKIPDPAAQGWGFLDMNLAVNAVTGPLEFVALPGGDTIACAPPLSVNLTGKIAVVYIAGCEFGSKALAAETAGAIAVVIINNVDETILMDGGTDGPTVTIPAIMISNTDGAVLRDAIVAGT